VKVISAYYSAMFTEITPGCIHTKYVGVHESFQQKKVKVS